MRISYWSSDVCSSDLRDERLADLPEAGHRLLPRMGVGAAHRIAQRREYLAFGRATGIGQPQFLGAPVAVAGPRRQIFARFEILHHPPQGLPGDVETREQVRTRKTRLSRDENARAGTRAPQAPLGKEPGMRVVGETR